MAKNQTTTTKANRFAGNLPEAKARIKGERIKRSGKTTRAKGHLGASTRRTQAKRDNANS